MSKNREQLINNIIGQLEGIKKMLNNDRDCVAVLTQMKAVDSAFSTLISKYLQENINICLDSKNQNDKELMEKLVKELVKN